MVADGWFGANGFGGALAVFGSFGVAVAVWRHWAAVQSLAAVMVLA